MELNHKLLELLNALLDMVVLPVTTIKTDKQHLYGCMIYNILQSIQYTHCITLDRNLYLSIYIVFTFCQKFAA